MNGPKDPRTGGSEDGARTRLEVGPKGPQAQPTHTKDRSHCGNTGSNVAAGPMTPSAKQS